MKKSFILLLLTLSLLAPVQAQSYRFTHGPYLQELTGNSVTVVFTTNGKGISWVETLTPQGDTLRSYTIVNGIKVSYNTFHTITIKDLQPGTTYRYRICSREITRFHPYEIRFGEDRTSRWYTFSTLDPKATSGSFIALSDMHEHADKLGRLLVKAGVKDANLVFYVGDMMNYNDNPEKPFECFIDKSVELFAGSKPFLFVRGNHETRGNRADEFFRFVPKSDGQYYGSCLYGDIMFVMLDCGEDKPDNFPVYGGLNNFDEYRTQQAAWLAALIKSKEYKRAKWHIVMSHFPPLALNDSTPEDHGLKEMEQKFLPILKKGKIDLMVCGHMHQFLFTTPHDNAQLTFPVVQNGTDTAVRIDIKDKSLHMTAYDAQGNVVTNYKIAK